MVDFREMAICLVPRALPECFHAFQAVESIFSAIKIGRAFVTARQSVLTKILLDQTLLPELFLKKLSATFYSFNLGCTGSPLQCLGLASGCGISFPDQERNPALGAQCQPLAHQGSPLNSFPTRRSLLDFCDVSAFSSLSKNCSPDPVCLVTAEV